MTTRLDTLELDSNGLAAAQDTVRRMAYFRWIDAGCPEGRALDCWLSAEREWIELDYVPSRPFDGTRPPQAEQDLQASQKVDAAGP
jgi:hypothetical protein